MFLQFMLSKNKFTWIIIFCGFQRTELTSPVPLWNKIRASGYDKYLSPTDAHKNATVVRVTVYFESLSSVKATTMDYKIDFYLMMKWYDPRLAHEGPEYVVTHDIGLMDELWHPDIYFTNSKTADYQYVTVPNMLMRIFPDGSIYESKRIRITASCMMDLSKYPMDEQTCKLRMLSYSNTIEQLLILWEGNDSFANAPDIKLPEFQILSLNTTYCNATYSSGIYSCLEGIFVIKRLSGYHLFQTFLPSASIVCISWITFWINPEAVPARVTLSITTLLTLATMSSGVRASLPPVSYTKAIDIWMMVCITFVITALLEFTIVNTMVQRSKKKTQQGEKNLKQTESNHDIEDNEDSTNSNLERPHSMETTKSPSPNSSLYQKFKLENRSHVSDRNSTINKTEPRFCLTNKKPTIITPNTSATTNTDPTLKEDPSDQESFNDLEVRPNTAKESLKQRWYDWAKTKGGSSLAFDYLSRWCFPLTFLIFNIVYWSKFTPTF